VAGGDSQRHSAVDSGDPGEERERLVAAISRAAGEQGYDKLTVEHVVRYAGVPPATFYEHFATTEQGLMAAFDAFLDRLWLEVSAVCETDADWPQKVRAALDVTLSYLAEAATLARVFAVEAAANLAATERQFAAVESFAAMLRDGRRLYPHAAELPAPTERALVGGIASIISGHLLAEEPQALSDLEPQLTELVLMPYLGQNEAKRIACG
jgi:AcrR family transcriptional regulator